jgi:hypothetical protein
LSITQQQCLYRRKKERNSYPLLAYKLAYNEHIHSETRNKSIKELDRIPLEVSMPDTQGKIKFNMPLSLK